MKTKDVINALLQCPMDDECKVRVVVNNQAFDASIAGALRVNEGKGPHTVIDTDLTLMPKVEFEQA